jgi:excisionase family DNA binding protein
MRASTLPPKLYAVPEAAELLSIDRSQVYVLINRGELAWVDMRVTAKRPRVRITQAEIDRFIKARTVAVRKAA